jgi:hypothetical protein
LCYGESDSLDRLSIEGLSAAARETSMSELFPPPELVSKCYALVSSTHARLGFANLPARVAVKESMVAIAMIPRMVHVLGSVSAFSKFRIVAWLLGAVSLALTVFVSAIWLIATVLVIVAERVLAAKERQQYMFLALSF